MSCELLMSLALEPGRVRDKTARQAGGHAGQAGSGGTGMCRGGGGAAAWQLRGRAAAPNSCPHRNVAALALLRLPWRLGMRCQRLGSKAVASGGGSGGGSKTQSCARPAAGGGLCCNPACCGRCGARPGGG